MDVAFSHLSWWLSSGKHQKPKISNGNSINSSADFVTRELDVLRFPSVKDETVSSSSRKVRHNWNSKEEAKIDKECDFVIVPSDGGFIDSDAESIDSDWSIGWLEPHGTGFTNDDEANRETDNSFAVLVPCYGYSYGAMLEVDPKSNLLSNGENFSDESKKYVESWISSLQNT